MDEVMDMPDWILEATPQTLADLWAARYGTEWVRVQDVEGDFHSVATRLGVLNRLIAHRPFPDGEFSYKLLGEKG
jgi:hypothetical protein